MIERSSAANHSIIVIGGPTASGKTRLAIELARHYGTEIISADSRQFYRELRIGNARPNEEELAAVPHHFIADRSIHDHLNAGGFEREALTRVAEIHRRSPVVIVVGGSGLYIKSLTEGLDHFPPVPEKIKKRVTGLSTLEGLAGLQAALKQADPDYFATVDQQNPRRLERALAVSWTAGRPYSTFLSTGRAPRPFNIIYLHPTFERVHLYERIHTRCHTMLATGLLDEVTSLLPYHGLPVLETVGYQEFFPHLAGTTSLDRATELFLRNSHRYAKRQITWLRRDGFWNPVRNANEAVKLIER
ncbi:MAG: tRNA (adenosine(37)-N6)-dimethylallyltransferase MiaA [Saprospiraceae bacterium]